LGVAVLTGVSPVLLVAELRRSVAYYHEQLGFDCHLYGDPPNFAPRPATGSRSNDAPHGFREFGVQDPDGHDIAFGQPIAGPA
jgi:hypothetical protein